MAAASSFIDEYSIERLEVVGRGSFGTVYKARMNDMIVAVKSYDEESEFKAFTVEVRQLSRVDHPNIIKLYGACATTSQPCLVMEYAENGSLHKMLHGKPKPRYTASHAMSWARQCAEGTAYLHAMRPKPLIHRDLKPPNLLLVNDGRILKICDFGTVVDKSTLMTNNKGSAAWMAPEVFEGSNYTEKCDVFSWAIILWEVIARRQPYKEFGIAYSIMWRVHMGDRPPTIVNLPKPIHELMTTCWDPKPSNRPAMDEVVSIMNALCNFFPNADEPIDFNHFIEEEVTISETATTTSFTNSQQTNPTDTSQIQRNFSSEFLSGESSFPDGEEARWASPEDNIAPRIISAPINSAERNQNIRNGMLKAQDVNLTPLSVDVDPNAWDLNIEELQTFLKSIPKTQGKERLTVTETRSSGLPENCAGAAGAEASASLSDDSDSSLDLDTMQLMLDPELQPEAPDPNSRLSQEIFKEHKDLAKEYLKIETEIAYKSRQRDELFEQMDPQERQMRQDIRQKLDEKESLLGLKAYLQQVLNSRPRPVNNQLAANDSRQQQPQPPPPYHQINQIPPAISEQNDDGWVHIN